MQEQKVTVYGSKFDLDNFGDVDTLHDLEQLDVFPKMEGKQKREAESELFNRVYAWNQDVDQHKSEAKVMLKPNDMAASVEVGTPPEAPKA